MDFTDWIKVGAGIRKGAWIVAKSLRMNTPDSKSQIFSRACKVWRAKNGYGAIDQRKDARVVLHHLSWIMEHEKEVFAWLMDLPEGERVGLNYPTSVFRAYHKHLRVLAKLAEEPEEDDGDEGEGDENEGGGGGDGPEHPAPENTGNPPRPPHTPLSEIRLKNLSDSPDIAATFFFDTYGDRADEVLWAIMRLRRTRRAVKR